MQAPGLGLIVVIILVIAALAIRRLRSPRAPKFGARRVRKRHIVTRILCAALAIAILIAIVIGTWWQLHCCYEDVETVPSVNVRVPTKEIARPAEPKHRKEIDKARLLIQLVVVVESFAGRLRPAHIEEIEIQWPEDSTGRSHAATSFKLAGSQITYDLSINRLYWEGGEVKAEGQQDLMCKYGQGRWQSNGRVIHGGVSYLGRPWIPYTLRHYPLSIVPRPFDVMCLFLFITPVAEDDALQEVPLSQFVKAREEEMQHLLKKEARYHAGLVYMPMRGLALAAHIGSSSLLLLAAAVLLSQLFARRSLAFPVLLAVMILYVAVLDRMALRTNLSRLSDTSAPLLTRLVACEQAKYTFFYRETALDAVGTIAKDPSAPAELRRVADKAKSSLHSSSSRDETRD